MVSHLFPTHFDEKNRAATEEYIFNLNGVFYLARMQAVDADDKLILKIENLKNLKNLVGWKVFSMH
jgi:hypothetical protein